MSCRIIPRLCNVLRSSERKGKKPVEIVFRVRLEIVSSETNSKRQSKPSAKHQKKAARRDRRRQTKAAARFEEEAWEVPPRSYNNAGYKSTAGRETQYPCSVVRGDNSVIRSGGFPDRFRDRRRSRSHQPSKAPKATSEAKPISETRGEKLQRAQPSAVASQVSKVTADKPQKKLSQHNNKLFHRTLRRGRSASSARSESQLVTEL